MIKDTILMFIIYLGIMFVSFMFISGIVFWVKILLNQ